MLHQRTKRPVQFLVAFGMVFAATDHMAFAKDARPEGPCHQYYPNVSGKTLLENDKMVVQWFVFEPGQWEGVHSHPADQLFIHIKGGRWTVRNGDTMTTGYSETGSVGFYGPVPLSAAHESVNSGNEPIDLIWVTLKTGCMKTK